MLSIILLASCVEKAESTQPRKAAQNKVAKPTPNRAKAQSKTAKANNTRVVNYSHAKLGNIAGKNTKKTPGNIVINKSPVVIGGWAIDKVNNSLPKDVFVVVGGKQFRAKLGADSGYLTKTYKNKPEFAKAGFSIAINKEKLKKGLNEVHLRVVGTDGVNYISKDKANIVVR